MTNTKKNQGVRIYGGKEHEVRVAERRQRLIHAGIKLFGENGFHSTTVRMVIADAGLAVRYFYESFTNMEALLIACYEHLMKEYHNKLANLLSKPYDSLEDLVRAGIYCHYEVMKNPVTARITQVEILGVSEIVDNIYYQATRDFGMLIMNIFTLFSGEHLNKQESDIIGVALSGALAVSAMQWVKDEYQPSIEHMVEATLTIQLGTFEQLIKKMKSVSKTEI